jgi:hypothetical protein
MVRRKRRSWLIAIGVATLSCPTAASGQIFARAPVAGSEDVAAEGNVSCGLISCPPNAVTFGVYHEHWRRWPEEPAATFPADLLSPFARPRRDVPPAQPPDKTHEESLAPPRRGLDGSTEPPVEPGTTPTRPATPPPPSPSPPARPPAVRNQPAPTPSEDRPSPLDETTAPSSSGGFFPSTGDEADAALPDDLPDTDLDGTLPPAELEGTTPSPPPSEPPQEEADDIFDLNLDEFGKVDAHRLQRYRMSSTRQLRRTDGDARSGRAPAARSSRARPPVQLAGYRRATHRSNPLRADAPVNHNSALDAATAYDATLDEEAAWQAEPARFESAQSEPTPLTWSEPSPPARRTNPLR